MYVAIQANDKIAKQGNEKTHIFGQLTVTIPNVALIQFVSQITHVLSVVAYIYNTVLSKVYIQMTCLKASYI